MLVFSKKLTYSKNKNDEKNIFVAGILLAASLAGFLSCKRDLVLKNGNTSPAGTAMVRIIDASPNFKSIFSQTDTFNVLFNGVKVSAYTPGTAALMAYNGLYPTASSNYGYVSVPAGPQQIKLTLGVLNPDSVEITTLSKTLDADKFYTFMITDSINSARDSSKIFIRDSSVQVSTGYYALRFIHAVWNDTAGEKIDIWSTRSNRTIYSGILPGAITGYTQLPYNALYNDTLFVRRSGTTFGLDTLNTVSFSNQRAYTLYYKGDGNINANNNIRRRHLATYLNK